MAENRLAIVLCLGQTKEASLDEKGSLPEFELFLWCSHRVTSWHQNHGLLSCVPAQNGQNGQSSPNGKSLPSSCGQLTFRSLMENDLTPGFSKKSSILAGRSGRPYIGSYQALPIVLGFGPLKTHAAILVVVLSSGP